mgnify:CR=1
MKLAHRFIGGNSAWIILFFRLAQRLAICYTFYDSVELGRSVSRDAIGYDAVDWNLVADVGNHPMNEVDADGESV